MHSVSSQLFFFIALGLCRIGQMSSWSSLSLKDEDPHAWIVDRPAAGSPQINPRLDADVVIRRLTGCVTCSRGIAGWSESRRAREGTGSAPVHCSQRDTIGHTST